MDNPSQNRFCDQCGAVLDAVCPSCGGTIRPEARFCGTCGKRIGEAAAAERRAEPEARSARPPASPPLAYRSPVVAYTPRHLADKILRSRSALEGERRQVTVLFADIAGFTTLAEKLDPEDVHRIVDRCFELITAEVHRFEGTINQYTGDGVMALFGAPIAHEDSPRRAAHAALAIQRALRGYDREVQAQGGLPLRMRIGLHTSIAGSLEKAAIKAADVGANNRHNLLSVTITPGGNMALVSGQNGSASLNGCVPRTAKAPPLSLETTPFDNSPSPHSIVAV